MEADIHQIKTILPQRIPFLMIDKVVEVKPGVKLTAMKNVSVNEPHFIGHFPDQKVMPGVLLVEAMTQAAYLYFYYSQKLDRKAVYSLETVEAKFLGPVIPGDRIRVEITPVQWADRRGTVKADVFVEEALAASAQIGIFVKDCLA